MISASTVLRAGRTFSSLSFAAVLAAGCTMIPHYDRPAPPVADHFPAEPLMPGHTHAERVKALAADIGWEDFFTDPRLKALLAIAMRENRDMRGAAAAVAAAAGQYEVQHAGLFPPIGATGQAMYMAPSRTGGLSFAPGVGQQISTFRYYSAGIGFSSYEIDLFGRIRSLSQSAAESALQQVANERSVRISVVSQVANAYIAWLGDRELLKVATDSTRNLEDNLRLIRLRYDHGQENMLTVRQAETQADQARQLKDQQIRLVAQDENLITLLIGAPLPADLPPPRPLGEQTIRADIPSGIPTDLLFRRPDILAAEHDLLAANANIGAARAAFFPKITLTASDGISSLMFRRLFTAPATTWGLNPNISIPIFTWGQNSGNLHAAKAQKQAKLNTYEKAIQTAFREVADTLVARSAFADQARQMDDYVQSSRDAYRLSRMRYQAGTDSYLNQLVMQRNLLQAEQARTSVVVGKYQNLVAFYRSLGGGWTQRSVDTATVPGNLTPRQNG
ncbi:efflux transporter outer membrane subunit [Acetobacter sp. AN02]|uniref:efflux transporter outer membrane subunit n=1 Tax=Acetobacter sp. AN02 TaxID=2894186 RepID=UPI002434228F|nr:efflux transporter outer membrane subunit [Acetobacter sp. AN02]MDG6094187.1 efflux transporter outer membrane subunit [Acetobacter sp. AN02]